MGHSPNERWLQIMARNGTNRVFDSDAIPRFQDLLVSRLDESRRAAKGDAMRGVEYQLQK